VECVDYSSGVAPGDGTGVEFRSADSPEVIFNWAVFHWAPDL